MAAKQTVETQFLSNAKQMLGELRLMNAELRNIRDGQQQMNATTRKGTSATKGHASAMKGQASAMKGLALRFVGYNLILNQVMGAQQKLIEFIKESVKSYREFELRLAEISTILGSDQIPLMERLKAGIEDLAISYGQATSDMSKGMYDILSAAFDAENALTLLTTATKASIAGLSDIRTSVDIFTTVLNTYGLQVEQATNVSNILFQSVIRGKFQFADLEQALGYVVPIAAQAGIAFKQLMAGLSTATRHGLHLDMTSRGLALAIQGIVNPSVKATKAAEKYGIEMNGLALRVMGLHGWFEKLNDATKEYGKSILGELIPNMRSLRVAMVLAGDVGLAGFSQDLTELAGMGNATEIALNKIMDTSQFVSNQLTQQWEKVKRDVGEDWDELMLNIQRGILVIADFFRGREYVSTAGEKYELIADDAIGNATEYFRILDDIAEKEKTRAPLKKQQEEYGEIGYWGRAFGEELPWAEEVKELDADLSNLYVTEQKFIDATAELIGGVRDEIDVLGDLEITLLNVELAITALEDELTKTFIYGFKDSAGVMKEASINISELTTLTQEQRDALSGLGDTIKGNLAYQYLALHAQREYADATHDVSMGLKIADYVYKEIPPDIQAAVNATREYTKAQDANKEATQRMTAAMRVYQIQLLEIQLKGMMRRRGLTRMEEKQIKVIQIAQAQARLENMYGQKSMLEADVTTYQEKKQLIDDYLLKLQEEQYELKYTYKQQIIDLETMISREGEKLLTRYDWWDTTYQKIIDTSADFMVRLKEISDEDVLVELMVDRGIAVDDLYDKIERMHNKALEAMGISTADTDDTTTFSPKEYLTTSPQNRFENILRNLGLPLPQYQGGIEYVPETQLAMVHKGETILPAGRESPSGITIGSVTIAVKEIADIDSVEKLGALLSQAESSGFMKRGKTNFRLRIG